jgi:hypothetical protein
MCAPTVPIRRTVKNVDGGAARVELFTHPTHPGSARQ